MSPTSQQQNEIQSKNFYTSVCKPLPDRVAVKTTKSDDYEDNSVLYNNNLAEPPIIMCDEIPTQ